MIFFEQTIKFDEPFFKPPVVLTTVFKTAKGNSSSIGCPTPKEPLLTWMEVRLLSLSGAHYLEPPSPILTLGVNLYTRIHLFLELIFCGFSWEFSRLCTSYCIPIHCCYAIKRYDLQNNNGEKRGKEFAQHAVHRRNNIFAGNMFLKIARYGKG